MKKDFTKYMFWIDNNNNTILLRNSLFNVTLEIESVTPASLQVFHIGKGLYFDR